MQKLKSKSTLFYTVNHTLGVNTSNAIESNQKSHSRNAMAKRKANNVVRNRKTAGNKKPASYDAPAQPQRHWIRFITRKKPLHNNRARKRSHRITKNHKNPSLTNSSPKTTRSRLSLLHRCGEKLRHPSKLPARLL